MSAAALVTRNRSGVFVGHCPPPAPGLDIRCAKAPPPKGSPYDFSLMVTIVRNGGTVEVTQLLPMANGELLVARRSVDVALTVRDRYVKKIESSSINGGVVGIRHDEVKEFYQHFVKAFFRTRTSIQRFSAAHDLLEQKENISDYRFPPPPDVPPPQAARFALAELPPVGRIWFPQVTQLEDGELEADDGQVVLGGDDDDPPSRNSAGTSPGLYIDVLGSDEPPVSITILKSIDAEGREKTLAATKCTTTTVTSTWEFVRKTTKRSLFRKKTKVKRIRETLLDVQAGCAPLPV